MGSFNDLTGQTFARLTALHRVANQGEHTMWRALCDCGTLINVRAQHLRNGNTKSCGCFDIDAVIARSTKHGGAYGPEYRSWAAMLQRCTNPKNKEWHNYGGRGIKVCERWFTAANFLSDMGARPQGKTLDRKDVNGDYEPGNCRWATPAEQAQNKRPRQPKKKTT